MNRESNTDKQSIPTVHQEHTEHTEQPRARRSTRKSARGSRNTVNPENPGDQGSAEKKPNFWQRFVSNLSLSKKRGSTKIQGDANTTSEHNNTGQAPTTSANRQSILAAGRRPSAEGAADNDKTVKNDEVESVTVPPLATYERKSQRKSVVLSEDANILSELDGASSPGPNTDPYQSRRMSFKHSSADQKPYQQNKNKPTMIPIKKPNYTGPMCYYMMYFAVDKDYYATLSIVITAILTCFILLDLATLVTERTDISTHKFTLAVLVSIIIFNKE